MARYAVAVLVVLGLAVGIWMVWPGLGEGPGGTFPDADATTTTSTQTTISTSLPTTTSIDVDHVVRTVEEAESILRALWFGWFEGIYNQDEDRIREVVATEEQVEVARRQFGVMEFTAPPTAEAITFSGTEILRSDDECLAVWSRASAQEFLGPGGTRQGVDVLRHSSNAWVLVGSWLHREDLWETDCVSVLP